MDPDEQAVRTLLAAAGLQPSDQEVTELTRGLPGHRRMIESLWAVVMGRDAEPALIFQAAPSLQSWTGPPEAPQARPPTD
jgi:hypothetical protein